MAKGSIERSKRAAMLRTSFFFVDNLELFPENEIRHQSSAEKEYPRTIFALGEFSKLRLLVVVGRRITEEVGRHKVEVSLVGPEAHSELVTELQAEFEKDESLQELSAVYSRNDGSWPVGEYRINVELDGKAIGYRTFQIEEYPEPLFGDLGAIGAALFLPGLFLRRVEWWESLVGSDKGLHETAPVLVLKGAAEVEITSALSGKELEFLIVASSPNGERLHGMTRFRGRSSGEQRMSFGFNIQLRDLEIDRGPLFIQILFGGHVLATKELRPQLSDSAAEGRGYTKMKEMVRLDGGGHEVGGRASRSLTLSSVQQERTPSTRLSHRPGEIFASDSTPWIKPSGEQSTERRAPVPLTEAISNKTAVNRPWIAGLDSAKEHLQTVENFLRNEHRSGIRPPYLWFTFHGDRGSGKSLMTECLAQILHECGFIDQYQPFEMTLYDLLGPNPRDSLKQIETLGAESRNRLIVFNQVEDLLTIVRESSHNGAVRLLERFLKSAERQALIMNFPEGASEALFKLVPQLALSRYQFRFPIRTAADHRAIFETIARRYGAKLSEDALQRFSELSSTERFDFGKIPLNGYLIERVVLNAVTRAKARLQSDQDKDPTPELTIQNDDLRGIEQLTSVSLYPVVPIDELLLERGLAELRALLGNDALRHSIEDFVSVTRFRLASNQPVLLPHFILAGPPGTGKTTVARIMGTLFRALGILPVGHLVETNRAGLVAQFIGQTAQKTIAAVQSALGGILFIDEAPNLVNSGATNDFGHEAISSLLLEMENRRGQFIVIAAGYQDEMTEFLRTNPGLASRFDETLVFLPYTDSELTEITEVFLAKQNVILSPAAREELRLIIESTRTRIGPRGFGNARVSRQLADKILHQQRLRLARRPSEMNTAEEVATIQVEDIKAIEFPEISEVRRRVGF